MHYFFLFVIAGENGGSIVSSGVGTYVTSWNDTNPANFLSPSAVSAATAVAVGLSPTHLTYNLNSEPYCHMQVKSFS